MCENGENGENGGMVRMVRMVLKKLIDIAANGLSVLLHPLFIPTYGFLWLGCAHVLSENKTFNLVVVLSTLFFTFLIPFGAILILRRQKRISSLRMMNASERTSPYIYSAVSFSFWNYLLIGVIHTPIYISVLSLSSTIMIAVIALINLRWKISAHMSAFGCFIGGALITASNIGMLSNGLIIVLFVIALLLMYARLYLRSHTGLQVSAGLLLGLVASAAAAFF